MERGPETKSLTVNASRTEAVHLDDWVWAITEGITHESLASLDNPTQRLRKDLSPSSVSEDCAMDPHTPSFHGFKEVVCRAIEGTDLRSVSTTTQQTPLENLVFPSNVFVKIDSSRPPLFLCRHCNGLWGNQEELFSPNDPISGALLKQHSKLVMYRLWRF